MTEDVVAERPVEVFVSPRGNGFMRDIASWITDAAATTGRGARLHADGATPTDPAAINLVVAPHELYPLSDLSDRGIADAAGISVPVCTEQPGTRWFEITEIVARHSPLALDINRHGVDALRARGIDARHLRLGGVPAMAASQRARDLDVLFLGGRTDHRAVELARLAPLLWDRRSEIRLFSFAAPVGDGAPGLVFGADKYALLARSRILVNVHRDDARPGYFEWARMVEAMANGCCIVTEPVADHDPFVAGTHFLVTDDVAATVGELLDDDARCRVVGESARAAVLDEHPLSASLVPILADLDRVRATPARHERAPRIREQMVRAEQRPLLPVFRPHRAVRERTWRALLAEIELQRRIDAARCTLHHGTPDHLTLERSPGWDAARPEVGVVVTLFGYAHLVTETLESLVASRDVDLEIVVVDDHSRDEGRAVVRDFMDRHPDLPLLLVGSDANRGLPTARNLGFEHVRAELVMVMDADNLVYPTGLRRLADALHADPGADFAYCTLEEFGTATGLRSAEAWSVERLCRSNHVDAQAMVRRSTWERRGGYPDDPALFGWEDWAFWLGIAATGGRGLHVPEILGRYRTQAESMIATSNLFGSEMLDHLRGRFPDLPWPAG